MENALQWTVSHDRYTVPFKSFQHALAYADQIASKAHGVKLINMEKSTIQIEQLVAVAWGDEPPGEVSAAVRHRRAVD